MDFEVVLWGPRMYFDGYVKQQRDGQVFCLLCQLAVAIIIHVCMPDILIHVSGLSPSKGLM
jgi:hypothetical protein